MKKKLIFMFSLFILFSINIPAQEQVQKPVDIFGKRAEKMAIELGLNDVEKANVKILLEKQSVEVKKLKADLSPEHNDFKVKMVALHKAQEEELKKTIGNEKYAKMKENRAKEKEKIAASKVKE